MKKEVQRWTKHFMDKGYDIVEARIKAHNRINFLKDCDKFKPSENKVDTFVYSK